MKTYYQAVVTHNLILSFRLATEYCMECKVLGIHWEAKQTRSFSARSNFHCCLLSLSLIWVPVFCTLHCSPGSSNNFPVPIHGGGPQGESESQRGGEEKDLGLKGSKQAQDGAWLRKQGKLASARKACHYKDRYSLRRSRPLGRARRRRSLGRGPSRPLCQQRSGPASPAAFRAPSPQSQFPPRRSGARGVHGGGASSGFQSLRAPSSRIRPPRQLPGSGCHRAEQLSACAGGSPGLRRRHFCCPDAESEAERVGDAIRFHPSRRPCRSRCRYG